MQGKRTQLYYRSTRGDGRKVSAARAVLAGIAGDGGLFVPSCIPSLEMNLEDLLPLDYQNRAFHIMKPYLTDFSPEEVRACIETAYGEKFSLPGIAPLVKAGDLFFLELYHGPTQAFKDMALTLLPHLMTTAIRKRGIRKEVVILTATSGDTGKAALEGFAGVPGTRVLVFFPETGVSPMQKRQMVTQEGDNVHVIGIDGDFDDAQSGVKDIFADEELHRKMERHNYCFSSANSINVGRLIPQIVYYFHAYLQACAAGDIALGQKVNFAVPTGNFGNILAGYYAKKMGLPITNFLCAANENRVLADFFRTGVYDRRRKLVSTMSPSMDILVSSNLERLLYEVSGRDAESVTRWMEELKNPGWYRIPREVAGAMADFYGETASEEETSEAIKEVFSETGYLMDPHTAVACAVYRKYIRQRADRTPTIILSTASPYKFARDVMHSLGLPASKDDFLLMESLSSYSGTRVPEPLRDLEKLPVRHRTLCTRQGMRGAVERILRG